MTTTIAPRTSADIAAELAQRQERRTELEARQAEARAELQSRRSARSRALVEGTPSPTSAEIAILDEEASAIASALELLAADVAGLEAEANAAALVEAEQAENDAIATATSALAELDAVVRNAATRRILPALEEFELAMKSAHQAENLRDSLTRKASSGEIHITHRVDRVVHRRTLLLELVGAVRRYVDTAQTH